MFGRCSGQKMNSHQDICPRVASEPEEKDIMEDQTHPFAVRGQIASTSAGNMMRVEL